MPLHINIPSKKHKRRIGRASMMNNRRGPAPAASSKTAETVEPLLPPPDRLSEIKAKLQRRETLKNAAATAKKQLAEAVADAAKADATPEMKQLAVQAWEWNRNQQSIYALASDLPAPHISSLRVLLAAEVAKADARAAHAVKQLSLSDLITERTEKYLLDGLSFNEARVEGGLDAQLLQMKQFTQFKDVSDNEEYLRLQKAAAASAAEAKKKREAEEKAYDSDETKEPPVEEDSDGNDLYGGGSDSTPEEEEKEDSEDDYPPSDFEDELAAKKRKAEETLLDDSDEEEQVKQPKRKRTNRAVTEKQPSVPYRQRKKEHQKTDNRRAAGTGPKTPANQVDASVKARMKGCKNNVRKAQRMATPATRKNGYTRSALLTDQDIEQEHWPYAIPGPFWYTEQKANQGGGSANARGVEAVALDQPLIHLYIASDDIREHVEANWHRVKPVFHSNYKSYLALKAIPLLKADTEDEDEGKEKEAETETEDED
jgi:hypothetical protein